MAWNVILIDAVVLCQVHEMWVHLDLLGLWMTAVIA